ncbi:NAD(P)/FAD-dependent oxidoreductase [Nocardioides bigeumensis]|uniref:FAD-binding domain-containing protein n=1 Tax=Nocardioides bigeumensis TaxID=433657 RepID=A0ABP5JEG1_9ACTN
MSANQHHWDLAIVGAGPAGASAALAALRLRPDLRVALVDRDDFPRDKCCGDGIAPHVLDVLRPLGAADVVDGWTPLRQLELAQGSRRVEGQMARPVHVVPREVFDAALVKHASDAGAVLMRHRVHEVSSGPDGVSLDDLLTADVVVGADGANSVVHTGLGLGRTSRRALAIRGYAPTTPELRARQVLRWGDVRQPSYAWAFDRGDGWSNIGYGELVTSGSGQGDGAGPTRRHLLGELARLLPGAAEQGERWRGHHLPLSGRGWGSEQPDGRVLLAGDAAGLVNPMTGEGIYYAVATGSLAGTSAASCLTEGRPQAAGGAHRTHVRRLLSQHLHHTWAAALLARRPEVVRAGIAAARRPRHFDALVELGLGDGRITRGLAVGLVAGLARDLTGRKVA